VICADDNELARGVAGMLMLSHPQHESPPEQAVRRMTSSAVRFPAKVYSARKSSGWHAATAAAAPATFAPSVREPPTTAPRAEQRRHARNNFAWNQLSWIDITQVTDTGAFQSLGVGWISQGANY
jgi:hypothetical protein